MINHTTTTTVGFMVRHDPYGKRMNGGAPVASPWSIVEKHSDGSIKVRGSAHTSGMAMTIATYQSEQHGITSPVEYRGPSAR